MKCAIIWVSQLCSNPVLPLTQNDDLPTSLLPASVHLHSVQLLFLQRFWDAHGSLTSSLLMSDPRTPALLLCWSISVTLQVSPALSINNFDFVGSVAQLGICRGGWVKICVGVISNQGITCPQP